MYEWLNSPVIAYIISGVIGFAGSILLAWFKLWRQGITAADAAEVLDRDKFRSHVMERVESLENRLAESEKAHYNCLLREQALQLELKDLKNDR